MELEFLRGRARLLSSLHTPCADIQSAHGVCGLQWTVSDFWFDQSAAFARAWLSERHLPAFLEQYEQLRQNVARPKLIVLLDLPAENLLARVHCRGRACERRLTEEQLDRIRQAVWEQANQPDVGPVLRAAGNPEAIFAEVLAAVRGME
jgi:deoxyadenosine/deoxycytidine kinase